MQSDRALTILAFVAVILLATFGAAQPSARYAPPPAPSHRAPAPLPVWHAYAPMIVLEPRATPTRVDLRTNTPRPTATRYTGTAMPTRTPYP